MALLLACLCTTISLTVLIVACLGGGTGGYTTRHGIRVSGDEHTQHILPKASVELATHAVLNEAREIDPRYTPERLKRIQYCSIEFVEEPFKCGYVPTGLCSGVYYPKKCKMKVALKGDDCGSNTALTHEIIHAVNDLVEQRTYSHGSQLFYGSDSVNAKANQTLWEYCEGDES